MRKMLAFSCLASFTAFAGPALADQCAWITPTQAEKAVQHLPTGKRYLSYCQPCGDKKPGRATAISSASERQVKGEARYHEVVINGKARDIAYIYVEDHEGVFKNVAKHAGCKTQGVDATVHLDGSGPGTSQAACKKTGCSAAVCADHNMITTCEFKPEYACYHAAECKRQADGKCGWTQTPALTKCLHDKKGAIPVPAPQ